MPLSEPQWWYGRDDWRARLLSPLGHVYGWVAGYRALRSGARVACPVVCVGNFTAGGTGKTPLALTTAKIVQDAGRKPAFLTRGFGGSHVGPIWLDEKRHTARDVGDEPLLLAKVAPVMVARDRARGADAIVQSDEKFDVIVMDDGLQNASLHKDLVIAVVDGQRGFGNGRVIPAGPLRAPLKVQTALADAVVINQGFRSHAPDAPVQSAEQIRPEGFAGPVFHANILVSGDTAWIRNARVLAYAGIGNPQRFFDLLRHLGADTVDTVVFGDHQELSDQQATDILGRAEKQDLTLVTTEKDWVRLVDNEAARGALKRKSKGIPISLTFAPDEHQQFAKLITNLL